MAGRPSPSEPDPVIGAIERVLQAERAAEQAVRDHKARAQDIVAAARVQADAITRRVDERLSRVRTAYVRKIQEELTAAPPPEGDKSSRATPSLLMEAASRLAAQLTGETT
jgi:hypothetical protein